MRFIRWFLHKIMQQILQLKANGHVLNPIGSKQKNRLYPILF